MNINHQRKLQAAFDELTKSGVWNSKYKHPPYNKFRRFGVNMKPHYYSPFIVNALIQGIFFVLVFGGLKYLTDWYRDRLESFSFVTILVSGVFVGVVMAAYFWHKKEKHNLSDWDNL